MAFKVRPLLTIPMTISPCFDKSNVCGVLTDAFTIGVILMVPRVTAAIALLKSFPAEVTVIV